MEVPGQTGWSFSGDKTVEFARFPLDFIGDRIKKYGSKVFVSRVLNKPHIFVTSNNGIKEMLMEKSSSFGMGYKDFGYMHNLYGDIFLFEDDEDAFRLRNIVKQLFVTNHCDFYMVKIQRMTQEKLHNISSRSSIDIYPKFKELTTSICLSLFLDIDDSKDYEIYRAAATTHWHGLISVPVSVKVKGWSSSYSRASEAKDSLLNIILEKLQNENNKGRFLECVSEAGFQDLNQAAHHILLFVSALIPKALSSLLTSFVIEMQGESKKNLREMALKECDLLDDILLEIQRLWPPLYGGRRISKENVNIDGYNIPVGTHVAYISRYGNRDADVFDEPDQFIPQRWQGKDKDKRNLVWTFGAGTRSCIGIQFINRIVKYIMVYLLSNYDWDVLNEELPTYKTLPVARPKESVFVAFIPNKKSVVEDS